MKKKAKLGFFAWLWVIIFFIYVLGRLISLYSLSLVRNIYYSQLTHYLFAGVHIFLILIIALVLTFAIKRNKDFVYFSLLFLGLGLLGDLINFVYSGDLIEILGGVILAGIFIPYILKSSTIKTLFPNPNKIFIQKNKNLLIFIGGIVMLANIILLVLLSSQLSGGEVPFVGERFVSYSLENLTLDPDQSLQIMLPHPKVENMLLVLISPDSPMDIVYIGSYNTSLNFSNQTHIENIGNYAFEDIYSLGHEGGWALSSSYREASILIHNPNTYEIRYNYSSSISIF